MGQRPYRNVSRSYWVIEQSRWSQSHMIDSTWVGPYSPDELFRGDRLGPYFSDGLFGGDHFGFYNAIQLEVKFFNWMGGESLWNGKSFVHTKWPLDMHFSCLVFGLENMFTSNGHCACTLIWKICLEHCNAIFSWLLMSRNHERERTSAYKNGRCACTWVIYYTCTLVLHHLVRHCVRMLCTLRPLCLLS